MELTPNEMRNQTFSSSFRGYNKAEVDAFIQSAADALEMTKAQLLQLTEEKELLEVRFEQIKGLEETIKSAAIEAQKNAEQFMTNTRKEAELILAEARQRRDQAIEEKYRRIAELESRLHELEIAKKSFYSRLRAEIEAHLHLIEAGVSPDLQNPVTEKSPEPAKIQADLKAEDVNRGEGMFHEETRPVETELKEETNDGKSPKYDF